LNVITGTVSCQGPLCWPRTDLWHLCLGACEIERASCALVAAVNINAASKHGVITQTEGRAVSIVVLNNLSRHACVNNKV